MLFGKELKKLLISYKGILILAVCLILKILLLGFFPEMKDNRIRLSQKQYDKYLVQLHGENTEEKSEFILTEYATCKETKDLFQSMKDLHEAGELSEAEWEDYCDAYAYAELHINSAGLFAEKAEQFAEQSKKLPPAHYIYEYGWQTVYTLLQFPDIFLLFGLLLLTAQCFSVEASGGMLPVLLAARDGRKRLFGAKLLALLTVGLGATLLGGGLEVLVFYLRGFLNDGGVPIYSVTAMTNCRLDLSLVQGYALCLGLRLAATLLFIALAYGLSIWLKNTTNLIFAGLCILGLPLLWGDALSLYFHGGLLSGTKALQWLGESGTSVILPLVVVTAYSGAVVFLASRRHQRGL